MPPCKRQPTLMVDICASCSRLKATLDHPTNAAAWVQDPDDASKKYLIARSVDAAINFAVQERSVQEVTTIAKRTNVTKASTQTTRSSRKRKADTIDEIELIQALVESSSQEDAPLDTAPEKASDDATPGNTTLEAETPVDHNKDLDGAPASEPEPDEPIQDATPEKLQSVTNVNATRERKKRQKRNDDLSSILDGIGDRFRQMQSSPKNIRMFDTQWSDIKRFVLDQNDLYETHGAQLPQIFDAAWNVGGAALFIEWKKILTYWRATSRDSQPNPTFPVLPVHGCVEETPQSSLPPSAQSESSLNTSTEAKLSSLHLARQKLKAAYQEFTASSASSQLQKTVYRNAIADIYAHYIDIQKQLADPDIQSGLDDSLAPATLLTQGSKQVASSSKIELFRAAHPGVDPPATRDDQSIAGKHWRSLGKVIEQGKRWYTLRQEWGPASLILWPSQSMSHSSLERLPQPLFTLLHHLVSRFRPNRLDLAAPFMAMFRQIATSQTPPTGFNHIERLSEDEIRAIAMDWSPNPSWLIESGEDRIVELSHPNRSVNDSEDEEIM
ncbi:uncharacterized protein PV09_09803 [Verruconis gallopava]|uniref:Uncharacterized protein n=1 Tax=Verruconis gallopava TaxID=253628 RepID=A0A0D1ZV18_9PEZI|nr:uncharacterized protein PV09_09803 [Verruconis gallopava]KIV98357.1 hypothetical protein PV09_09803 [Verruconis gallopava]